MSPRELLELAQSSSARATGVLALAVASGRLKKHQLVEATENLDAALQAVKALGESRESRESSS